MIEEVLNSLIGYGNNEIDYEVFDLTGEQLKLKHEDTMHLRNMWFSFLISFPLTMTGIFFLLLNQFLPKKDNLVLLLKDCNASTLEYINQYYTSQSLTQSLSQTALIVSYIYFFIVLIIFLRLYNERVKKYNEDLWYIRYKLEGYFDDFHYEEENMDIILFDPYK